MGRIFEKRLKATFIETKGGFLWFPLGRLRRGYVFEEADARQFLRFLMRLTWTVAAVDVASMVFIWTTVFDFSDIRLLYSMLAIICISTAFYHILLAVRLRHQPRSEVRALRFMDNAGRIASLFKTRQLIFFTGLGTVGSLVSAMSAIGFWTSGESVPALFMLFNCIWLAAMAAYIFIGLQNRKYFQDDLN